MTMPFTRGQFLDVFVVYNAAIWPAQIAALCLGLVAVGQVFLKPVQATRSIFAILVILWLVNAIAYHAFFFSRINPAAWLFAGAFLLQAIVFASASARPESMSFHIHRDPRTACGLAAIGYALLIYPLLGQWAGHGFMGGPMFGVAPCPTTIFTIGILLLARGRSVLALSVIPILWSLIGFAAAVQLGIPEDLGLPLAGLVLAVILAIEAAPANRLPTS